MTTEYTTDKRRMTPIDARLNALIRSVWSALFAGAFTTVFAHTIVEYLSLPDLYEGLAMIPIILALADHIGGEP